MKICKYISVFSLAALMLLGATGCSDEKLGPTIFPDVPDDVDAGSYTYKFDTWLNRNFRDIYNLNLFYKMKDVEANQDYNLVPATLDNAMDLALLTKYLWFDAYAELNTQEFLKQYGPRIIHLIGSPAYNPTAGTEILGLAEGGLKVSLFKVNAMEIDNINQLNEYYFRTMHHEFGHILHQTKSYPTEFNLLSNGLYDTNNWQSKDPGQMLSLGFITPYSSAENREDFAETIANYVTRTQEQLDLLMWAARQNYSTGITPVEGEQPDDEAPYYAFYFYVDNAARMNDERTYILRFVDRPTINGVVDYRVGYMEGENMPANFATGSFLATVAEVEDYINTLSERLKQAQREHEATTIFGKRFSQLSAQEQASVNSTVDKMTFVLKVQEDDGVNGEQKILEKQNIARNWFKDTWGLDFDKLREVVQKRQNNKDAGLAALRAEVEAIQ